MYISSLRVKIKTFYFNLKQISNTINAQQQTKQIKHIQNK